MKSKNPATLLLAFTAMACTSQLQAAISYATPGSSYMENFDTLLDKSPSANTWTNDTTIPGWTWARNIGGSISTSGTYSLRVGDGGAQGSVLSLGSSGSIDRALGAQSSDGTNSIHYGAQILNTTTQNLSSFTLGYTGETWRYFPNEATDKLTFEYQIFTTGTGSLTAATGWVAATSLNYTAYDGGTGTAGTQLDGNNTLYRTALSATISGISWENGQTLWVRWSDVSPSGNIRSMMGVDEVSFSAVPEPSALLLSALGALALLSRRAR